MMFTVWWFVLSSVMPIGITQPLYKSSFISKWYDVEAGNNKNSVLNIPHYLNEYPVKVDVQVKVLDNGKEYIFSGIGSSQRDDDLPQNFGAVIYRYNNTHVQLGFPFENNDHHDRQVGLAYSGTGTLYDGPPAPKGPYISGQVRVRAWLSTDMPQPVFNISTDISNRKGENYRELEHGLGSSPDIVTVRTLMGTGYMSDGIGVVFASNTPDSGGLGGVVFGYDDIKVRLWIPTYKDENEEGGVFYADDGYSFKSAKEGTAYIHGWKIAKQQIVFGSEERVGPGLTHASAQRISCAFDLTNYLVSVQYKVPHGNDSGLLFYAEGTTQASTQFRYGGIVYVYTEDEILLWHPKNTSVMYVGDRWGDNQMSLDSSDAIVIVTIYFLLKSECPYPDIPGNATFSITGQSFNDILNYTCDEGFVLIGGNQRRTCGRARKWAGFPPICIDEQLMAEPNCSNTVKTYNIISDAELNKMLDEMRVDKKGTSASIRKKTSASDSRNSSKFIGLFGVFIIIIIFAFLVIPDILSVFRYLLCECKGKKTI